MIRFPVVLAVMVALGFAALAPWGASAATAGEPAGTVLALSGPCAVESGGVHRTLALNDAVRVGDTVMVPAGAKLKLRMTDGSVVSAAAGTTLTIDAYTVDPGDHHRDARLSLTQGLVRAVVSSVTAPSRFEIDTATAVAAVRSTDWFLERRPALTRVGVLDGVVDLTAHGSGKSVAVPKRYGARVDAAGDPTEPLPWSAREFDEYIQATTLP